MVPEVTAVADALLVEVIRVMEEIVSVSVGGVKVGGSSSDGCTLVGMIAMSAGPIGVGAAGGMSVLVGSVLAVGTSSGCSSGSISIIVSAV